MAAGTGAAGCVRFGSICSGIEAASVAWAGWEAAWFSEIEPFPCALLQHHYPAVPNLGDITASDFLSRAQGLGSIDVIVGGTPCQSFSVAGQRQGMDDDRGLLAFQFVEAARLLQPSWVVWENVPGVLSSAGGRDFGAFLQALGECGYGVAYRVLDAQHFGVPQRRRRVFVVGHLGDWRRAAAVLFERESLSGHPAAGGEKGQDIAACLGGGSGSRRWSSDTDRMTFLGVPDPAYTLADSTGNRTGTGRDAQDTFVVEGAEEIRAERQSSANPEDKVPRHVRSELRAPSRSSCGSTVAIHQNQQGEVHVGDLAHDMQVRRLTPRECERLQGFSDDYTLIQYRGKPAADAPRYKALGNSMAVPVVRWIQQRLEEVRCL